MMSKKTVAIIAAALLGLAGIGLILFRRNNEQGNIAAGSGCVKAKPGKFPAWQDSNVPGGDINTIARKYFPEMDPGPTGSIVGGFFKAIDTFPSEAAAKYYSTQLKKWVPSNEGLPYWHVLKGELLCNSVA